MIEFDYITELRKIAARHGYTLEQLRAPGRQKGRPEARAECYRYLRDRNWSLPRIGAFFGRDHTTVLWWLNPAFREGKIAAYHRRRGRDTPPSQAA